jgi:integrase
MVGNRGSRGVRDPLGSENMNPEKGDGVNTLVLATGEGTGLNQQLLANEDLLNFLFWMKREGLSEKTIVLYGGKLRLLLKLGASLDDPETVKEVLAKNKRSSRWLALAVAAYSKFLKYKGLSWEPPKVEETRKLPFIPLESELDALIAGCGRKTATLLQLLKETGMRVGEALRLRWPDIDFERNVVILNEPEKKSNPRAFKVSSKLIEMLKALPKTGVKVFPAKYHSINETFLASRKRLAEKLNNPRLLRITFHTFRHWKATMEYHKTRDILRVKELLGHRDIDNTMLYVQVEKTLFEDDNDEFIVKTAKDPVEIKSLLEVGFQYVCEKDGLMFFRKRK